MSPPDPQFETGAGATFRHRAACNLVAVREATRLLRTFLQASGVAEAEADALELVCAEAANNAVRYATEAGRERLVVIEALLGAGSVELRVTDHTPGFDLPLEVELPDLDAESGRGLFLIRSIMDEVDYLRGRDENVLVARRALPRLPGRAPTARELELEAELGQMTEELASAYESLSAIFRFSTALGGSERGPAWIEKWMLELCRVTGADWFQFRLADPKDLSLRIVASSAVEPAPPLTAKAGGEDLAEVRAILTRQDVWFDRRQALAEADPLLAFGRRMSGVVHPIFVGADPTGVLTLGREIEADPFSAGQVNVIHTLADFLGIEVCNARVQDENLRARVLHRELEIASSILASLLPAVIPQQPGLALAATMAAASEMGGDFYDVIEIPGTGTLLVIADVMGKGMSAALFAAIFRSHLRSRLDLARQPEQLLTWVNRTLFADLDRVDMFITAQLALVDLPGRQVRIASAGHCPLLLAQPGGEVREFGSEGPPLGIEAETAYLGSTFSLCPGDTGILFTDGVPEMSDREGDFYGLARFKSWWGERAGGTPPGELGRALMAELDAFRTTRPARDDVAFVIFQHPA